ncbi:MAG: DoxX family membrane protein [Deltaproteobacteria bacterium]|nr:DoxX family membrane protein [Deltaproteobacteria bacterium]
MTIGGWHRFAGWFCRCLVGGIFFYAGALKMADVIVFAGEVAAYHLIPHNFTYLVAAILPGIEVLIGALLLLDCRVRGAAFLAGVLNLIFILALVSALARGLNISCGCFGLGHDSTVLKALSRDLALMVAIVVTFLSACIPEASVETASTGTALTEAEIAHPGEHSETT